jgi:hypothetical protein
MYPTLKLTSEHLHLGYTPCLYQMADVLSLTGLLTQPPTIVHVFRRAWPICAEAYNRMRELSISIACILVGRPKFYIINVSRSKG